MPWHTVVETSGQRDPKTRKRFVMGEPGKLSRRTFLSAIASTTATSCLPIAGGAILAVESTETSQAQYTHVSASGEAPTPAPLAVANAGYRLLVSQENGAIVALTSTHGVDRDLLIPDHAALPLFKIERNSA